MEKLTLNNEIVRCRAMIRKAKVRVIRKKIKQIKLLKGCKNKDPKKLQKAERFLKEVLAMKKIKEDHVTKFALQQSPSEKIRSAKDDKERSMAILANQTEVKEMIEKIKKQVNAEALPELLKTLGTRSLLRKFKLINKGITPKDVKARKMSKKARVPQAAEEKEEEEEPAFLDRQEGTDSEASDEEYGDTEEIHETLPRREVKRNTPSLLRPVYKETKYSRLDRTSSGDESPEEVPEIRKVKRIRKVKDPSPVKEVKVDDPFFVSKKVAVPKLLLDEVKDDPSKEIKFSRDEEERPWGRSNHFTDNRPKRFDRQNDRGKRPIPAKFERRTQHDAPESTPAPEKLHPSWAAKRQAQTIKPFQGKKITFDED